MAGFTVSNSNRFLETGRMIGGQSSGVENKPSLGGSSESSSATSFADTLKNAIGSVNEMQKSADKAMQNLATGKTDNVAEVMIAAEQADLALKLMVQVRNKIIDTYQEVMKMQV
jgi:flagellar hook-basal body complex protein FliE